MICSFRTISLSVYSNINHNDRRNAVLESFEDLVPGSQAFNLSLSFWKAIQS
jgi:hypothetical protein